MSVSPINLPPCEDVSTERSFRAITYTAKQGVNKRVLGFLHLTLRPAIATTVREVMPFVKLTENGTQILYS